MFRGEYNNNRIIVPEFNIPLRTDVQFHEFIDDRLHNVKSPLHDTGIVFFSQFVLDLMRLVCFG